MKLWQNFFVRLIIGWVVVTILPALLWFWKIIFSNAIEASLTNSVIASAVAVVCSLLLAEKLARFPGQNAFYLTGTAVIAVLLGIFLVFFAFRLEYSVYYFSTSIPLLVAFCFFSQNILQQISKQVIAYIPIGRATSLTHIDTVEWYELDKKAKMPYSFSAVVADLSDETLQDKWARQLAHISIQGIPVYHVIEAQELLTGRIAMRHLYENNLGSLTPSPIYLLLKRCMDIGIVLLSLPVTLLIMIITFVLIRLESQGGAIFIQQRMGQGGQPFKMYKFRSMRVDDPNQNKLMTQANDSRITKVGKVIRKLRIDELPQFYNVLKGDMSLIGPRPELPSEVERLENEIPFYIYRQIVKPGISGWAQVMQGDGHVENIQTKLEYDFYYIKNFSFTLDFLIVIKTIQTMLTGFGAR